MGSTSDHTACWEEGGLDRAWRLGFQRFPDPSPPQPSSPAWRARGLPCTHTHVKEPICSPALTGRGCRKNCPLRECRAGQKIPSGKYFTPNRVKSQTCPAGLSSPPGAQGVKCLARSFRLLCRSGDYGLTARQVWLDPRQATGQPGARPGQGAEHHDTPFLCEPRLGPRGTPHMNTPPQTHQSLLTGARRLPGQHPTVRKATAPAASKLL